MDFFYELISNRESIRNYDPARPVDAATLDRILDAGRLAPSAANRQPFRFLLISSPEMLEKVRPCYLRSWFQDAPHILVPVGNANKAWVRSDSYNSIETDLAIALDHMILAAEHEGVATCWVESYDPAILKRALMIKDYERIFAITPLGYPRGGFAKSNNKQRKALNQLIELL